MKNAYHMYNRAVSDTHIKMESHTEKTVFTYANKMALTYTDETVANEMALTYTDETVANEMALTHTDETVANEMALTHTDETVANEMALTYTNEMLFAHTEETVFTHTKMDKHTNEMVTIVLLLLRNILLVWAESCPTYVLWSHCSVEYKCRYLNLQLYRSFYLKHDFKTLVAKLQKTCLWFFGHPFKCFVFHTAMLFVLPIFVSACFSSFIEYTEWYCYVKPIHQDSTLQPVNVSVFGGGKLQPFTIDDLQPYIEKTVNITDKFFTFYQYIHVSQVNTIHSGTLFCYMPLSSLYMKLNMKEISSIAKLHGIKFKSKCSKQEIHNLLVNHDCAVCKSHVTIFNVHQIKSNIERVRKYQAKTKVQMAIKNKAKANNNNKERCQKYRLKHKTTFPPHKVNNILIERVIRDFCKDLSENNLTESGCAVCGMLTPMKEMTSLDEYKALLGPLYTNGTNRTRLERKSSSQIAQELLGPTILSDLKSVCKTCGQALRSKKIPTLALANGLWLGEVPSELQNLRYAEKMLIARCRHNRCIMRVSSGMHKMRSNAITFPHPMPKIYHALPPPKEEIDEVLAFIFTGPCKPTEKDLQRTPMLVRRNKVALALNWLKLNHIDYEDLEISQENLMALPENDIPVQVSYRPTEMTKTPEGMSVDDMGEEEGTTEGECPFVVHGLTGEELHAKGEHPKTMKMLAMAHLKAGKVLAIGHGENPESLYNNPQLFPQMFPWLFPYGLGGIKNVRQSNALLKKSELSQKRHLLMYHDKRFQLDPFFPLIAFNHEQIKASTTGGFLLAEKKCFNDITHRLLTLDSQVIESVSQRMAKGEIVKPVNDQESKCFQMLKDLDHIGSKVQGSTTQKKNMRNEIWSLINYLGAPSWYITLSPADVKSPICLYYADTNEKFHPQILEDNERYRLIANNPVAGARFFHFMIQAFIKHVLGVGTDHPGIYGKTSAYYGTVEQQGRLTLHLHMLLWILNALTPKEIRDQIMDKNSDFQKKLVEYLESSHIGEFLTGTFEEVKYKQEVNKLSKDYIDPTLTLPQMPPSRCPDKSCSTCEECIRVKITPHGPST